MNLAGFVIEIVDKSREWMDIDGGDLQEMLEKHGIIVRQPATETDCEEEWAQEYGIEPGDTILRDAPELTSLRRTVVGGSVSPPTLNAE